MDLIRIRWYIKRGIKWALWITMLALLTISIRRLLINEGELLKFAIQTFEPTFRSLSKKLSEIQTTDWLSILLGLGIALVCFILVGSILLTLIYFIRKIFVHVILQEESIDEKDGRWGMMIRGAAGNEEKLRNMVEAQLQTAQIPYTCSWRLMRVSSSTMIQRERRPFLIVSWKKFPSYRIYIGIRDFGTHLQVERITTIETGIFKKLIAWLLTGDRDGLSKPVNILSASNLIAWKSVVYSCVKDATVVLMEELKRDAETIGKVNFHSDNKGYVDVW